MSAWLPSDVKRETPTPYSAARRLSSSARLPLCEMIPIDPGVNVVRADVELGGGVVDAEAVRADHHGTCGPDALDDGGLARLAGVVDLAEPGRDRDDRLRAGSERVVDRLLEGELWQGDDDEIGLTGKLCERRVRITAEDLSALAVDEPHLAPMRSA